jgi:ElaB/YqjD/DUF883 family membrane-anchored ribosome-binding protein
MADEIQMILDRMYESRRSLSDRFGCLESEVVDAVRATKGTVTGVVDSVRHVAEETAQSVNDCVKETWHSVGQTLDLERQVRAHPWTAVGGAAALGFLAGEFLRIRENGHHASLEPMMTGTEPVLREDWRTPQRPEPIAPAPEPGFVARIEPEIDRLKRLTIGTVFGVIRDLVMDAAPPALAKDLSAVIDGITTKMGGKPMPSRIVPESSSSSFGSPSTAGAHCASSTSARW